MYIFTVYYMKTPSLDKSHVDMALRVILQRWDSIGEVDGWTFDLFQLKWFYFISIYLYIFIYIYIVCGEWWGRYAVPHLVQTKQLGQCHFLFPFLPPIVCLLIYNCAINLEINMKTCRLQIILTREDSMRNTG